MFIRLPPRLALLSYTHTLLSIINWRSFHGTPIPRGDISTLRCAGRDSRQPARNLREQRRDEPAPSRGSRPACVARPAAGPKRQRPYDRGHLRASAQQQTNVAEEFSAASEVSAATRSAPLHHEANCRRAQEKRRAVPAHVVGCSLSGSKSPRCKVPSRRRCAHVARGRDHVRLHVLARSASSWPDFVAGPSARLPHPRAKYLAMG